MAKKEYDYTKDDLANSFRCAGVQENDIVYCHVWMSNIGVPMEQAEGAQSKFEVIYGALMDVIGPEGTVLSPTFTYSFCSGEVFDPEKTTSSAGYFGECLRKLPGARRSLDPLFSSAGIGPRVEELFHHLPNESLGKDCLFDRLGKAGARLCNIGVDLFYTTANHFVQDMFGSVPCRFPKLFSGYVSLGEKLVKQSWIYYVRVLGEYSRPRFDQMQHSAVEKGICRLEPVGKGTVVSILFSDMYKHFTARLHENSWDCVAGPPCDPVKMEEERVGVQEFSISLPPGSSMQEMIDELWVLPRDIVSDGYDAALRALADQVPMKIHEYHTGSRCFTWIVPEKWTCHEACLESLDGKRLLSYKDNPLHVVSYSLPFEGKVDRNTLFQHLYTHPTLPEAIPFMFKYYERDWGICCSSKFKESLKDDRYCVTIRSDFSYGKLKVGEVIVKGEKEDSFVFCAHLCHPHMVNDDLSGVVVGIDVMRELLKRKNLRFSYRFLLVPETIGSAAYLAHNEDLIQVLRGGLFLEMFGKKQCFTLQKSARGDTFFDRIIESVVKEHDSASKIEPFLNAALNDERMFNAPGIQIPMLSLSRSFPRSHKDVLYYKEYHSSWDTPENMDLDCLGDARDLVLKIIDAIETSDIPAYPEADSIPCAGDICGISDETGVNRIPVPCFKGELFCSRFNEIDYGTMGLDVLELIYHIDGRNSVTDIANATSFDLSKAEKYLNILAKEKLITWKG